ncbi:hypothetical protein ACIBG8_13505 [Nonomuraea sp. NPDC050556]|uniref:hypothetical protein n=1 Tax=Nonomuraea sp. NPDC050556 TaxID=3364369 RepID=UPI00378B416D
MKATAAILILLCTCLAGCYRTVQAGQACVDHAGREIGLYLKTVDSALPPKEQIVSVDEWMGCDTAGKGAAVDITVSSELKASDLMTMLQKAGWSAEDPVERRDGIRMTKKAGTRVVEVRIRELSAEDAAPYQSEGTLLSVGAGDDCWDNC